MNQHQSEIEELIASLQLPTNQTQHQNQPTRSGRIPQRPNPNDSSLNPLDFLDFPDESESDDPDFDPLKSELDLNLNHHQSLLEKTCSSSSLDFHTPTPQLEWLQNHKISNETCQTEQRQQSDSIDHNLGFDFSTFSDQPAWNFRDPVESQANHFDDSSTITTTATTATTTTRPFNQSKKNQDPKDSNPLQGFSKLSPLTEGEIAGVPFVNIQLPDSDDSDEFIPPPSVPSSSRPPKRIKRDFSLRQTDLIDTHQQSTSRLFPASSSKSKNPPPQSSSTSLKQRKEYHPDQTLKLPESISSRYVAIAPSPNYSETPKANRHLRITHDSDYDRSTQTEDDEDEDEDDCHQASRTLTASKASLKVNSPSRPKPGPKSKKISRADLMKIDDHREDFMKRKREGMRKNRERKKLYVVSLEDRCLELAEENARLRQENEQLMRESRENWKSKAKSLEMFKLLNRQLQKQAQGQGMVSRRGEIDRLGYFPSSTVEMGTYQKTKLSEVEEHQPESGLLDSNLKGCSKNLGFLKEPSSSRLNHNDLASVCASSFGRSRGRTLLDVLALKP